MKSILAKTSQMDQVTPLVASTPDAAVLLQKMKNKEKTSKVDLIEDIGRKTSKQSLMQLTQQQKNPQQTTPPPKPKLRGFGASNKPKMLGLIKKAGKLQRLNCLEAERVLFVLDQFRSRLLLLTGLHASLVSDVVHFPQEILNLKKMTTDSEPDIEALMLQTKETLRFLSTRPGICALIRNRGKDVRFRRLNQLVEDLRNSLLTRLAQKQSVADDEIFTIRKADRKRVETVVQIDKIRAELKKVEDEKQREYEKAAMQINELKHEIEQTNKYREKVCEDIINDSMAKMSEQSASSMQNQSHLIKVTKPLELEWKKLLIAHREEELVQRGRKFRMQVELENWLSKYDDFMEFQNSKIEIIQDEYDAEKADYNELSARFAVLKEEYDAIMYERRLIREEEERKQREFEQKTFYSQIIQAYFRAYMFRKYAKTGGKRKKAKGGKGKKGKK